MGKLVFSATNGKHIPSGGGHYFARGEQGQLIEVHPDVYQQQFEAYLKRLGVKPTTYHEILKKAEQEWNAFAQLMDAFAEDLEQWQTYRSKGVYVEEGFPFPEKTPEEKRDASCLDAMFEEIKTITVTRLAPEVLTILRQQGCIVDERGLANIRVTFPEQTRRQPLLPPTAIERSRIVLAGGLELRHEIDREREMSLLAVVRSQAAQRGYDEQLHQ